MRYLLALLVLLASAGADVSAAPSISAAYNTQVRDLRATASLSQANLDALRKIGDDYANAYRAKTMETYLKEPGRMRVEAKAIGITFTQITNGNTVYTSVLGIKRTMDITHRPQNRQSSVELGFLTPTSLQDFTTRYLHSEKQQGRTTQVYELRYKQKGLERKKVLLWVDVARKVLVRRELWQEDGTLKARFTYLNPKQVTKGVWLPTRITVHNGAGELGGTTNYSGIRVNTGLPDSLFTGI